MRPTKRTAACATRLLILSVLLSPSLAGQERQLRRELSKNVTANSFVIARNGEALLYNHEAGVNGVPFLPGVFKSFGFSHDLLHFLYLKANGKFPTFALYSLDINTGKEKQITDAAVHLAAWSPTEPVLAYVSLDAENRFHLSTYDLTSGRHADVATGRLRSDFLEWSPDGAELLYMDATPLTDRAAEDGHYTNTLHRYSIAANSETAIPAVEWAQFTGNQLVVLSRRASLRYRTVPNPRAEDIQRFAIAGGDTFAEFTENGSAVVKRWNPATTTFETAHRGQIFLRTPTGIVTRQFTNTGVAYEYVSANGAQPLAQSSALSWKIPFAGVASIVQGGQLYVDGSCDGAACFVTSHGGTLGYALDFQQMPENREGNTHVLASGDGTVAVVANNVACNSGTVGCAVGWDDYSTTCSDNGGAGNHVAVAHLDGTYSLHAHLKSGSIQVVPGQNVLQGTYLADQGHSGVAHSYNNYLGCGDHLHFSRQIGPGIWEQSVPTDFVETPCLVGCRSPYSSANVELAPVPTLSTVVPSSWTPGATVPITINGSNFVYGTTVGISGSAITISNVAMLSPTRLTASLSIPAGTAPGPYNITVTSPNGSSNAIPFNVIAPAAGGTISGSVTTSSGAQNLTAQGSSDWAHWGLSTDLSFNEKSGVVSQIGNFTVVGSGTPVRYTNDPLAYGWSDGTPTTLTAGTSTGLLVAGQNNGFSITAPADTSLRTLTVYVGVSSAQGLFRAQLSDGSAPDFIDSSLNSSGASAGAYTVAYRAASGGQTLVVTFTQTSAAGTVSLQAAVLSGGNAAPDFAVSAAPAGQSLLLGNTNSYAVNISALSGFSDTATLSVNGLPAGIAATFNPPSITGSGSSTLTLTAANGTAIGNYPLSITATAGASSRSANVDLSVLDFAVTATPASRGVIAGGNITYTISVPGPVGSVANISLSAGGLPAGATATFNPGTILPGASSILTVTVPAGTTPGSYPLSVTASAGTISHNTPITLTVTAAAAGGGLTASKAAPSNVAQLTTEGSSDWVHWGLTTAASVDRKAAVPQQISDLALVGGGNLYRYSNNSAAFTWTDGTPTASATGSTTGIFTMGIGKGFSITAPADTTTRTLRVYVGAFQTQGRIIARLSDGSAPDYIDTSLSNSTPPTTLAVYTFTYTAASSGQTLTVTYTQNTDVPNGNVTIQAATLAGSPDFTVATTPASQSVVAGQSIPYTVAVGAIGGFANTVGLSLSGLPAGVTAAFNPASVTASGSSTLTVTTAGGATPGTYPLIVTGTSGSITHSAAISLTITAPVTGGTLNGSMLTPSATVQLTTEGTSDWAHWGLNTAADFDHKAGVTQQISNLTLVAGGTATRYANNGTGFTWNDGTPTASATNSTTGIFLTGVNNGFRLTVPADTTARTLRVYVGAWRTQGKMLAHLSDGSAPDFVDTSLSNSAGVTTLGVYTLTYSAASSGQTLTVTYTQNTATAGNVTIQAASLAGTVLTQDFTASATPASQTVVPGGTAPYTVNIGALNGFAGNVALSVSGLPAGVTATFSPTSVTGTGSSTMTLTISSGAVAGNYPLTVSATSGNVSHSANVTIVVTDFSISAAPASQTVAAGANTPYNVTVSPVNGFAGSAGFSVSGLPAGVTATFSPTTVTGGGSSTMTLATTAATAAGSYPVTITAASGTATHTTNVTLVVTAPAAGGTLTGAFGAPVGPVQLTTEGTSDWSHWALATAADFNHKSGVVQQISNYSIVGSGTPTRYANNGVGFTWTDGTPTASATATTTGVFITGVGQGFRITAPADTTSRTLRVYVGAWRAQARMIAHLSDGSAADYSDGSLTNNAGATTLRVYTLTYRAAVAGQTLTVTFTQETPTVSGVTGNVALQAATLASAGPDFTVSATPGTQPAVAGDSAAYTLNVTAQNGFAGTVNFGITGLPSGVTAAFSPTTVTGSGSSTMTLTTTAGIAAGNFALTVTGTSSVLSHNANVTLSVTDFSVSTTPSAQTVISGANAAYSVTVTPANAFTGSVGFTVSGLPSGVTAAFSPATVTGSGSSTMTLTTTSGAVPGNYPLTITATSGVASHTAAATLVVTDFSVSGAPASQSITAGSNAGYAVNVTALGGFTGTVALSASGLPSGVTAVFSPASLTNAGSSTMTLTAGATTAAGTYPVTITASSGGISHTASVTLIVTLAPEFSVTATPASSTTVAGNTASYTATVSALNGFTGDVALTVSGLPAAATAAFNPATVTGGSGGSTLTVTTATGTAGGNYQLTITGTSGTLAHTANVTLTVTDFSISASPGTQSAIVGGSAAYTVTVGALSGFGGDVNLSVSGAPAGVTATFNPATVTGSGSSTMTLTVAGGTATGSFALTVTGSSGALSHGTSATLVITDFSLSASPLTQTVVAGAATSYTVPVTALNGFAGTTAFTVSGLPTGVTASFNPTTVSGAGSSTMTVTTTSAVVAGNYLLTITGTSGGIARSANATLSITDFSVSATPGSQSIAAGASAPYTITLAASNGFTGAIGLTVSGLPVGATAGFNPATVTDSGPSAMTVTTSTTTAAGTYPLTITASSGGVTHTASASLTITPAPDFSISASPSTQPAFPGGTAAYTVTLAALNGFSNDVSLGVSGLPAGATAAFTPSVVTGGSGSSTLTLTTTSAITAGNYALTITGTGGSIVHTSGVILSVSDYSVSAAPGSKTAVAGGSASYTVSVSSLNGFAAAVGLGVSGLPAGATAAFSPATVTGSGSSTATVTVPAGTATGSYPLTFTASSGALSHTATATLVVTDFSVSVTPATQTIVAGGGAPYTVGVTGLNGFTGSVGFVVSGLPAGVTAAFSPATVTGSGSSTMTLTSTSATLAGSYPLTVTASSGGASHTATATLGVTAPAGGTLSGSGTTPTGPVQLTTEGTSDWAHWALGTTADFNHKAAVTQQISNYSVVGSGTPARYANNGIGFTWTDGTPTASATATTTGLFINGQGQGFRLTAPADTTVRTLRVYVGAWRAQARMIAHLSDGSAADYSDGTLTNNSGVTTLKVYTLTYSAATAGQTLTVTFTQENPTVVGTTGNVALQAATLAGGAPAPDFTTTVTPGSQSVAAGANAAYTATIGSLNGFSAGVTFTVGGLPAGVTASFNPATVTGSGSSAITLTTTAGTAAGTYPLTLTATTGSISHTASLSLTVTPPLGSGALTGSVAAPTGTIQLTTEGTADWTHWGIATATDFDHKAAVTQQISNFTSVSGGVPTRYVNNAVGFTWTDGTPTALATNSTTGVFVAGQGQGFRITVPADTSVRTLRVYIGAWRAQGKLVAHLSDGSAVDYLDTSVVNTAGATTLGVYTLTYHAATSGQTLTVTFTQNNATAGNVTIQAATLQ